MRASALLTVNGSSSSGLVIDLNRMNKIEVIPKYKIYDGSTVEVVSFEGVSEGDVVSRNDLCLPSHARPLPCTHRALRPHRSSTRSLPRAGASSRRVCALSAWVLVAFANHMRCIAS